MMQFVEKLEGEQLLALKKELMCQFHSAVEIWQKQFVNGTMK